MTGALRELSGTWTAWIPGSSSSSSQRFGFGGVPGTVLAMIGLTLAALGGAAVYQVLGNTAPLEVTCREFARARPDEAWLRVTSCAVDYLGAGYRDADGKIVELFFPCALPASPPASQPRWWRQRATRQSWRLPKTASAAGDSRTRNNSS